MPRHDQGRQSIARAFMAYTWHSCGIARVRISTTVDGELLRNARDAGVGANDAELIDAALQALLAQHRRVQIDDAYDTAYRQRPLDEPDDWGDLESFRDAVSGA